MLLESSYTTRMGMICSITILLLVIDACVAKQRNNECILVVSDKVLATSISFKHSSHVLQDNYTEGTCLKVISIPSNFYAIERFVTTIGYMVGNVTGSECSEVIGVVGDVDSKTASILHTLASRSNLSLTIVSAVAPSTFLPVTHLPLPNVLDMRPLSHYLQAIVSFIQQWNWTRIGLISDDSYYYKYAAELLQDRLKGNSDKRIAPVLEVGVSAEDNQTVLQLKEYATHIIVVMANTISSRSLLESAHKNGMLWPEYVWIMLSFELEVDDYPEGAFFVQNCVPINAQTSTCNISDKLGNYSCNINQILLNLNVSTEGTNLLHDSLLAVVSSESNDFSFCGKTGQVLFRDGERLQDISIVLAFNGSRKEMAYYNTHAQKLIMFGDFDEFPQDSAFVIYNQSSPTHTALVIAMLATSTVFVLTIILLYICFRKQPEIKATSVSVSLCMLIGSLLLLVQALLVLLDAQPASNLAIPANLICFFLAWFSAIGFPTALILSALLVKILRVYTIFNKPLSYHKKSFTDAFLLLYIVILISPNILVLVLWSAIDPLTNREIVISNKSHNVVLEECSSQHIFVWPLLLLAYVVILTLVLAILAFKTSRVRYKNFKDTKATNAFAFLTILSISTTLCYWLFFDSLEPSVRNFRAAEVCLYVGHVSIALLCPMLLFLPKLFFPVKRCFCGEGRNLIATSTFEISNKITVPSVIPKN